MAKKDPFDTFREATLSSSVNPLKSALTTDRDPVVDQRVPVRPEAVQPTVADTPSIDSKISKNADRELVSFHIDKKLKYHLGFLKFKTGKSYGDLYCEAVRDLLIKNGMNPDE